MKQIITWIALACFGTVSALAVVRVVRTEFRASASLDRAGIEAWLVDPSDKTPSPISLRRGAWMLERDFHTEYEWTPYYRTLDAAVQKRFRDRWSLLLDEMFLQRSRKYLALPPSQMPEYLEAQLVQLNTWYALDEKGRHVSGPALFVAQAQSSSTDRPLAPGDAKAVQRFRGDMGNFAAERALRRILPGLNNDKKPPKRED